MVVAGRRASVEGRRRPVRRLPRMVLLAVVASLVVVAVNSIVSSSAEGPDPALVFADRVRPAIDRSSRQSGAVEELRRGAPELGRTGVQRGLDRLLRESRAIIAEVEQAPAEDDLRRVHGLLLTCLTTRHEALETMSATISGRFESGPPDQAIDALVEVGQDLAVADRAYELFLERLPPKARASMAKSIWVPETSRFGRPEMASFIQTLRAEAGLMQVRDVSIVTVATDPLPVGSDGLNKILPVTKSMRLQVVVANSGSILEKRVTVEAVVTSQGGLDTARQFVDLAPGQRQTVTLTLRPAPVGVLELKTRVGPIDGEFNLADNEQLSYFVMR